MTTAAHTVIGKLSKVCWCRLSTDLGSFVGLSPGPATYEPSPGSSPVQSLIPTMCPFPMPPQYEDAKEGKVQTVSVLRNQINRVSLIACATAQVHGASSGAKHVPTMCALDACLRNLLYEML